MFEVQVHLLDQARDLLMLQNDIQFSKNEPFLTLLKMLFDYFSPEEHDNEEIKEFLRNIRNKICSIISMQLIERGTQETVTILTRFLCPDITKFNHIKDVLRIISQYQHKIKAACKESIFEKHIIASSKNKSQGNCFLTSIFLLLYRAIMHTQQLKAKNVLRTSTEQVISSTIEILLSFNWPKICENILIKHGSPQHNSSKILQSSSDNPNDRIENKILKCLKHSNIHETMEINIISWVMQIPFTCFKQGKPIQQHFLGKLAYVSMLKKIFNKDVGFINCELEDIYSIIENCTEEINAPFAVSLFTKIFGNIHVFEPDIHELIFKGFKKISDNSVFFPQVLCSDEIFKCMIHLILNGNYKSQEKLLIEDFILIFLLNNWEVNQMVDAISKFFYEIRKLDSEELIKFIIKLIGRLLQSLLKFENETGIFHLLEFVYFIEDFAISNPAILSKTEFHNALLMLVLLLDKAGMIFFWFPSFGPDAFDHDISFDYDFHCTQREGGCVRVILRLVLSCLLKSEENFHLLIQILEFFVFHKKELYSALIKYVQQTEKIIIDVWEYEQYSFLNIGRSDVIFKQKNFGFVLEEKSVTQQKSISYIISTYKDVFESKHYRSLVLFTYLMQIIIYDFYNTQQYQNIDFSQYNKKKPASEKIKMIVGIISEIFDFQSQDFFSKLEQEVDLRINKQFRMQIKTCFTDIEMIQKMLVPAIYCEINAGTPAVKDANLQVDYDFKSYQIICESIQSTADTLSLGEVFIKDFEIYFSNIQNEWLRLQNQKETKEEFIQNFLGLALKMENIQIVQAGLHDLFTEDFKFIDKAIYLLSYKKQKAFEKESENLTQAIEYGSSRLRLCKREVKIAELEKILQEQASIYLENGFKEKETQTTASVNEAYAELNKLVFSEEPFLERDKESEMVFKIISTNYKKILTRCPLYKQVGYLSNTTPFKTFMKLDSRIDNLGRAMRLKPIKNPLKLPSIIKGISFMREVFLKKSLLLSLVHAEFPEKANSLIFEKRYLLPDECTANIIKTCLEKLHIKQKKRRPSKHESTSKIHAEPQRRYSKVGPILCALSSNSACKSQLSAQKERKKFREFDCEIIKVDSSFFGLLRITNKAIIFESKDKAEDDKYRLGSTQEMNAQLVTQKRKKWKFTEIKEIVLRRYIFIKQAFEIQLANKKSFFILLFSKEYLQEFLQDLITVNEFDCKIRDYEVGEAVKSTKEEWKKKEITNFEYLMKLNDLAGRTFKCMSQYPVFPWVIKEYTQSRLDFSGPIYRDFKCPIAGMSERKRLMGDKKYKDTKDMPEGVFQYGTHYLPGRAVLGYLLRLQPFTQMIYKFDSGGDCATRHYHFHQKRWEDSQIDCDMNMELVPEFFYNPEFLANQ